jgi:pimeloyl-ACP methyl ester carboxylesterase
MEISIMRDGLCLRGRQEGPVEGAHPAVILFHGFTGDLGYEKDSLFAILSEKLTEKGLVTVRFDFNGHGKSDGAFVHMDVLNEIEDAIAILQYVRRLEYVTDIYVLGHSQGGVVAGMLAGLYPDVIRRLVLLAPAATLKDDARKGVCMGTEYDTEHIPQTVALNGGAHVVGGHYFRIAKLLPIYEVTGRFRGPVLDIHGRADEVVDASASKRYKEVLENCRLLIDDGLDHGLEGTGRERAIEEVVRFCTAKTL